MADSPPTVVEITGRFVGASNATLLGVDDTGRRVVYKPIAGERPLWDFPSETLAIREVLTYEVSEQMGIGIVPRTTLGEGPFGPGAIQEYVDHDPEFDPIALVRKDDPSLWPVALLDVVTNNADRKLGHLLSDGRRVIAIDHGLTFHPDDKLRTVLWGFAGEPVPAGMLGALDTLLAATHAGLGARIRATLGLAERDALQRRIERLIRAGVHPSPPTDRPPIPWPPY